VAQFDDPDTGYPSQPDRKYKPKFSDYEHLARVKEWSVEGGGDE
jgi:ATP-dependent helicase/nuclease subunit B